MFRELVSISAAVKLAVHTDGDRCATQGNWSINWQDIARRTSIVRCGRAPYIDTRRIDTRIGKQCIDERILSRDLLFQVGRECEHAGKRRRRRLRS